MRAAMNRFATWWMLRRMKYPGHTLPDGTIVYHCPKCGHGNAYPDLGTLVALRCSHQEFWVP